MKTENALYPTGEQLSETVKAGSEGPVVMVNLLKFRERSEYKDGGEKPCSGREAYARYSAQMLPFVQAHGGRVLFVGEVRSLVIGSVEEQWDVVALVEYPSSAAFAKIAMSPDVAKFGVHRAAGLEGQLLIQTVAARS